MTSLVLRSSQASVLPSVTVWSMRSGSYACPLIAQKVPFRLSPSREKVHVIEMSLGGSTSRGVGSRSGTLRSGALLRTRNPHQLTDPRAGPGLAVGAARS